MNEHFPRLPPLTSLRGFEAAARLGSFSRAADDLFLTQSAISHQIRVLEDYFQQPLFMRVGRSVELTDAGSDFFNTTVKVLRMLDRGSRRMAIYLESSAVVIYAPQSFAARWLTPRLSGLRAKYSDIETWIDSFDEFPDLETTEAHLAIALSDEPIPNWTCEDLLDDAVVPLCHRDLHSLSEAADLAGFLGRQQLLHDERQIAWSDWLRHAEISLSDPLAGARYSEPGLALDAAVYGQGVALGSLVLAERDIASGVLMPLSPVILKAPEKYRLVYHSDSLKSAAVSRTRDWLLEEAEKTKAALEGLGFHLA